MARAFGPVGVESPSFLFLPGPLAAGLRRQQEGRADASCLLVVLLAPFGGGGSRPPARDKTEVQDMSGDDFCPSPAPAASSLLSARFMASGETDDVARVTARGCHTGGQDERNQEQHALLLPIEVTPLYEYLQHQSNSPAHSVKS